jgi:hypothetical protein
MELACHIVRASKGGAAAASDIGIPIECAAEIQVRALPYITRPE